MADDSPTLSTIAPLRVRRRFAAPPAAVFDAWTDPEVLRRWWAAQPTWTSPGCDLDLRVGGAYTLRMRADDGTIHAVAGEFREIDRPARLVYTWRWVGDDGLHPGHVSLVTVDFRPDGDGTVVELEHAQLASEESRVRHGAGWNGVMDNLERRVLGGGS
jgi:uncharacterized protein YndB with AHSA1/START domain